MAHARHIVPAVVVSCALLVLACDSTDVTQPTEQELSATTPVTASASLISANVHARGADQVFLSLHQEVPGFGGMFVGDDGASLYVYMKDIRKGTQISAALERRFGQTFRTRRIGREGNVKELALTILQADYDAEELLAWKNSLRGHWLDYEMTYLDLDERNNRIHVGVEGQENVIAFSEHVAQLGIPGDAVHVEVIRPADPLIGPVPTESSAMVSDTVQGGILAQNPDSGGGACTVGFTAKWFGIRGFVTASHCTETLFGTDASGMAEFENSAGALIGRERSDPPSTNPWMAMRGSDAAFVRSSGINAWELGDIFLGTVAPQPNHKILSRSDIDTGMYLDWLFSHPILVGESVGKYGITTGLTEGVVAATCVEASSGFPEFLIECANKVVGPVAPGDSGGPVFQRPKSGFIWVDPLDPANRHPLSILGIVSIGLAGSHYYYSPMSVIVTELGPLQVQCRPDDPTFPLCN